jgi:hypothetical protein
MVSEKVTSREDILQMDLGSIASATVFATRTANIVGSEYVKVPIVDTSNVSEIDSTFTLGRYVPVNSKTMTARETVVLVTPAKVAAAPIIAHL